MLDLINLQTITQELCDVNSSENEDHVCSIFIVNQLKMANASHLSIHSYEKYTVFLIKFKFRNIHTIAHKINEK